MRRHWNNNPCSECGQHLPSGATMEENKCRCFHLLYNLSGRNNVGGNFHSVGCGKLLLLRGITSEAEGNSFGNSSAAIS